MQTSRQCLTFWSAKTSKRSLIGIPRGTTAVPLGYLLQYCLIYCTNSYCSTCKVLATRSYSASWAIGIPS